MRRQNTQHISQVLQLFLRENGLEKPFLEHKLVELWPKVLGSMVQRYTRKVEINDGVLYAYITSAALRQELFLCRFQLVEKLNNEVGAEIIKDIRLLS